MSPWQVETDPARLRRLGKQLEELGELVAVTARCIIQGIDGVNPADGKPNRQWLTEEIADVAAQLRCTKDAFSLDKATINDRIAQKMSQMQLWEDACGESET